jgi:hypothetical protein
MPDSFYSNSTRGGLFFQKCFFLLMGLERKQAIEMAMRQINTGRVGGSGDGSIGTKARLLRGEGDQERAGKRTCGNEVY